MTVKVLAHFERYNIFAEEQKGCKKNKHGCKDQTIIEASIVGQANQRNFSKARKSSPEILEMSLILVTLLLGCTFKSIQANDKVDSTSGLIAIILDRYYIQRQVPLLIHIEGDPSQAEFIHRISTKINSPRVLQLSQSVSEYKSWFYAVLFLENYSSFQSACRRLDSDDFDLFGYYTLVFIQANQTEIWSMFNILWDLKITRAVIIAINDGEPRLYNYSPYARNKCGTPSVQQVELTVATELFKHRLTDLHNCPLRLGTFETSPFIRFLPSSEDVTSVSGFEGDLITAISTKLRFSLRIVTPPDGLQWGVPNRNESTGLMRVLYEGAAHFGIGCLGLIAERNEILQPGRPHYTSRVVFAVPDGRPYNSFEKLFKPFGFLLWIGLVATIGLAGVTILCLKFFSEGVRRFVYGRNNNAAFLNVLSVLYNGGVGKSPTRNFARTLLILWISYCLVLRTAYQGALFRHLQANKKHKHLETMDEIQRSDDLHFYMLKISERFFQNNSRVLGRVRTIKPGNESLNGALDALASKKLPGGVVLVSRDHIAFHNKHRLHIGFIRSTRDYLASLPIVIYYPKRSFLVQEFNRVIGSLETAGLISYWVRQYGNYDFFPKDTAQVRPTPLNIGQLMGCFETCAVMWTIACGVFVLELLSGKVVFLREMLDFMSSGQLFDMIALTILTAITLSHTLIQLPSDPSGDLLIEATVKVLEESFSRDVDTVYFCSFLTYKRSDAVGSIIIRTAGLLPVIIKAADVTLDHRPKQRHSVILLDSWRSLMMFEDHISRNRFDCTGYFLILLSSNLGCYELMSTVLKIAANYLMYNINILYRYEEVVKMYTYFPYGSKGGAVKGIVCWNRFEATGFTTRRQHFPRKLENFHGSALRVALFNVIPFVELVYDNQQRVIDFMGIEGSLLQTILHLLNFTVVPVELPASVRWGNLYPNGSATGAMQLLLNGSVDLTVGFFGNNPLRQQYMTGTFSYYQTALTLIISPGDEYGSLEKLTLPFQFSLWICIASVIVIGALVIIALKTLPRFVQSFVFGQGNNTPLMNFIQSTMGNQVNPSPRRNFARFLLLIWVLSTFILRTAYQQIMFYNYHHIKTHQAPHDYDEFNANHYHIYAVPSELYLFERLQSQGRVTIVSAEKNADMLQAIRYGRVKGARVSYPEYVHHLNEQALIEGRPIYHQFDERLYSYSLSFFFRKDSPLVDSFDRTIYPLVTHGFVQHWKREKYDRKLATLIRDDQRRVRMEPLTVRMLTGAFGLYLVGMVCAGLVFVGEMCVNIRH
ncbi:uncharacterized protein LOC129761544 [Toxorhynchites rutilus septentrionalis]|uniref:uncharacterized protein LOC129761544 n=1 Tax=Toxorhynchites rutilus septentrionalis TaxID=329112 RepID=UPI002479BA0C|nr:uncharacterized protein LOC129761544 [Toxorhynchites rutilus septentrionalis]